MANLYSNHSGHGVTGAPGSQSTSYTTRSGKTITPDKLMLDDPRVVTDQKRSHRAALREAITFAQYAEREEIYINKARETGSTAYNIAIVDWLGAPKVLEINVDDWNGEIGQTIHVKARDNVMVTRVTIVIRDAEENVLEAGDAVQVQEGSAWWNYTTQSQVRMSPFPIVEATAEDLPGNTDLFAIS